MWYLILWMVGKGMVTAYAGPIEFSHTFTTQPRCEEVGQQWFKDNERYYICLYASKEEKGSE